MKREQERAAREAKNREAEAQQRQAEAALDELPPLNALERYLFESFGDVVASPGCADMTAEEIAIGLLKEYAKPPEEDELLHDLPLEAVLVAIGSALRLGKGYSPDIPTEMNADDGVAWSSSVDFQRRIVRLYRRTKQYSRTEDGDSQMDEVPIARFMGMTL